MEPLNIILDSGKSPAETWKNLFLGEWNNNVDMIYETNYFKVLKKMKKFNTIEEIRNEIDKLDLKIVELISQRKDLVSEVVKLKRKDQIIDQERIDQILKKLNLEAKKRGIPEVMIEKLWDIMIKSFIEYEEEIYDEVHKKLKKVRGSLQQLIFLF